MAKLSGGGGRLGDFSKRVEVSGQWLGAMLEGYFATCASWSCIFTVRGLAI
jgi:hypothetical protein